MSIKGKIFEVAAKKALGKALESEKVGAFLDNAVGQLHRSSNLPNRENLLSDTCLILKDSTYSTKALIAPIISSTKVPSLSYEITDKDGTLKYSARPSCGIVHDGISVYNENHQQIGKIKNLLIAVDTPFEKNKQKFIITYGKEKVCKLKKYTYSKTHGYEVLDGPVKIKYNDDFNIKIFYQDRLLVELCNLPIGTSKEKFILKNFTPDNEPIAVLMAVAIAGFDSNFL